MHNTFDNLTDEDLVLRVKSGGIEAFGFLVERYEDKMKRYARKFLFGYTDIEDTVQKVFIKAYVNIQSFDTSRKFSSWLYRIAHNEFINAIKKKTKVFVTVMPGREKKSAMAKKIRSKLKGGDLDDIIKFLPAGGSEIKKQR